MQLLYMVPWADRFVHENKSISFYQSSPTGLSADFVHEVGGGGETARGEANAFKNSQATGTPIPAAYALFWGGAGPVGVPPDQSCATYRVLRWRWHIQRGLSMRQSFLDWKWRNERLKQSRRLPVGGDLALLLDPLSAGLP